MPRQCPPTPPRARMAVGTRTVGGDAGAMVKEEQIPPTVKQALPAPTDAVEEQQDQPVHHSQEALAAAAALSEAAEEVPPKLAWQCGTPGCDLANFHQGPHKCQQVVGPRQRRRSVRAHAAAETSEAPAVAAKSVRKKRAGSSLEEMETHETLPEAKRPTAAVASPVASADVMHSTRDRLASTNPDPRRTDFLVRLFVFGHT